MLWFMYRSLTTHLVGQVLCGNTLQRAAKRRVGWDRLPCLGHSVKPCGRQQQNHSVLLLGQEGSFAFLFYPDSKQGLQ